MRASIAPAIFSFAVLLACGKSKTASHDAAASAVAAREAGDARDAGDDDDVRPVYPIDGVSPHPLAKRLCEALHELPEKRRAACCAESARALPTAECVRMASAAIQATATLLSPASVDACASALDEVFKGCDWVGPFPPPVPVACLGLFKGTLKEKARCRSSLECEGTLRCHGVGPTTPGRCGPPKQDGAGCFGTADALAAVTRQDDLDRSHPECRGFCDRIKCAPTVASGGACGSTRECEPGHVCEVEPSKSQAPTRSVDAGGVGSRGAVGTKARCVARAPAKLGESCAGDVCERGLRCDSGRCAARRAAGVTCERDFDCLGGCVKPDGGTKGVCGKKCDVR